MFNHLIYNYHMHNLYAIFAKFLDICKQITGNSVNGARLFHQKNNDLHQCFKFQAFHLEFVRAPFGGLYGFGMTKRATLKINLL